MCHVLQPVEISAVRLKFTITRSHWSVCLPITHFNPSCVFSVFGGSVMFSRMRLLRAADSDVFWSLSKERHLMIFQWQRKSSSLPRLLLTHNDGRHLKNPVFRNVYNSIGRFKAHHLFKLDCIYMQSARWQKKCYVSRWTKWIMYNSISSNQYCFMQPLCMNARQTGTPVGACDCEVQSNSTDFNRKPVTGCREDRLISWV